MTVDAETFLESAKKLAQGGSEIDYRNAASRAYYSVMHRCDPIAEEMDPAPNVNGGLHQELIERFRNGPSDKHKGIAYILVQCRGLRVSADYHIREDFTKEHAETAMESCERAWEKLTVLGR